MGNQQSVLKDIIQDENLPHPWNYCRGEQVKYFSDLDDVDRHIKNFLIYKSGPKIGGRSTYDADVRYFKSRDLYGGEQSHIMVCDNEKCDFDCGECGDSDRRGPYYGDTMISFATLYKEALLRATKERKKYRLSECFGLRRCYDDLEGNHEETREMFGSALDDLASLVYTPGNFILLPKVPTKGFRRMMNPARYSKAQDRIDSSIFFFFAKEGENGDILAKYFSFNHGKVKEWIREQYLNSNILFPGGKLLQEEIADLSHTGGKKIAEVGHKPFRNMNDCEFQLYIENAIRLIEWRNKQLGYSRDGQMV